MDSSRGASGTAPGAAALEAVIRDNAELALIWLDPAGTITGWLGASERLFGYGAAEAVGQPFSLLFTEEDRARGVDRFEVVLAERTGRSEDDRWHRRRDGSRFWSNGLLLRWCDDGGPLRGYAKLVRDHTDVRIRDVALRRRVEVLAADAARHQERLLTLLHEVRTPLATLVNVARVMASPVADDARQRMVDVLLRQTLVLERLVVDAAAAGSGASERLELAPVVLQSALEVAVDALREAAAQRRQTLELLAPPVGVVLQADAHLLQRMLLNLIGNALKYTPEGGRITVSATTEGEQAVIRVDDDGVGIAPENLARIFELYVREDHDDPMADGQGIGLAVVRRLAALHGGFVEARSPGKGKGSQFKLQLPLRPSSHTPRLLDG